MMIHIKIFFFNVNFKNVQVTVSKHRNLQFPVQYKLITDRILSYKITFSSLFGFNFSFGCKYARSSSVWPINSLSKFSVKCLKSYTTKYVKLNEDTPRKGAAAYYIVNEPSLTGKRKLKAKCVANESSTPSQQSLLQKEKPG